MSSVRRPLLLPLTYMVFAAGALGALLFAADVRAEAPGQALGQKAQAAPASSGGDLFAQNCVACHGAKGDGDGPAAAALDPKPRKLSSKEIMAKISDEQITTAIKGGGAANGKSPLMPAWPQFSDDQVKSLVAHIRTLCGCKYVP